MTLVDTKKMFKMARRGGYAIGAFNVNKINYEHWLTSQEFSIENRMTTRLAVQKDCVKEYLIVGEKHLTSRRHLAKRDIVSLW